MGPPGSSAASVTLTAISVLGTSSPVSSGGLSRVHCTSNGLLSYWGFTGRMAFPGWQQQIAPDSVACEEQGFVLSQSSDKKSEVKVSPGCSPSEGSGEGPSCFFPLPVAVAVGASLRPPPPAPPL